MKKCEIATAISGTRERNSVNVNNEKAVTKLESEA